MKEIGKEISLQTQVKVVVVQTVNGGTEISENNLHLCSKDERKSYKVLQLIL